LARAQECWSLAAKPGRRKPREKRAAREKISENGSSETCFFIFDNIITIKNDGQ
jgi:hypothetical protein